MGAPLLLIPTAFMADATFFTLSAAQRQLIRQVPGQQSASALQANSQLCIPGVHHGSAFCSSCPASKQHHHVCWVTSCMWLLQKLPSSRWPKSVLVHEVHGAELPPCIHHVLYRFLDACLSRPPHTCQAVARPLPPTYCAPKLLRPV